MDATVLGLLLTVTFLVWPRRKRPERAPAATPVKVREARQRRGPRGHHVLIRSVGLEATGGFKRWRVFRYEEGALEEGMMVSVIGRVTRETHPDGERVDPRQPPERVVLRSPAGYRVIIQSPSR